MTSETEVIACPACRHLVRIPADWLGTAVQCPECKSQFTAPVREGGTLGEAVLLSQPDADRVSPRPASDALWIPAFALMLLGVVSLVANATTLYAIATDRAKFEKNKKEDAADWAEQLGQDRKAVGEDHPAANWPVLLGFAIWGVVCGGASFAGGAAIALRRGYALARIGSALAAVNFAGLCRVPGAIVGGRAWMLLGTDEGRAHFLP
jgi:hypothetical protein